VIDLRQFEECNFKRRGEITLSSRDDVNLAEIRLYHGLIDVLQSPDKPASEITSFIETWRMEHRELCGKSYLLMQSSSMA
jgi:hypothetical protein